MILSGWLFYRHLAGLLDLQTTRKGWTFPGVVYSAPLLLPGPSLRDVLQHMKASGYIPISSGPVHSGQYQFAGGTLAFVRRSFEYPGKIGQGEHFELSWNDEGLDRIVEASSGQTLDTLTLDPVLLGTFASTSETRRWIPLTALPPSLIQAVITIEDRRFYSHVGIDPRGLLRALWANLRAGRFAQGGSTLTQQLARNLFLTRRRTLHRKVAEAGLALLMERRYTKPEIMEMYLNQIYLGQQGPVGICGVEEASRVYFGKKAAGLTLGESALLAGIIRAPNRYSPNAHPDQAQKRRDLVLNRMESEGWITPEERHLAAQEPIGVRPPEQGSGRQAPYFLSYIHGLLSNRYTPIALSTQGFSVFTTLDYRLQVIGEDLIRQSPYPSALVAIDPRTGDILAMVGGRDFRESQFNRAVQARRQPGSAFKPFVLAAALEQGRTLVSKEIDTPLELADWQDTWRPQNFDSAHYRGPVTVREMITHSINIPTVRLALRVGLPNVVDVAKRLGIQSPLMPVPSLALGSMEVNLLELTRAYSVWAALGMAHGERSVISVLNHRDEIVEENGVGSDRVLSPQIAALVNDVLAGVLKEGTARWAKDWGFEGIAAGKTGTTTDYRDAWFIGYRPELACGVWVGHDLPRSLKLTGAQAALPIWSRFMAGALGDRAKAPFPGADGVIETRVDLESGELARSGCLQVRKELFIEGTEPQTQCQLHAGGVGGWLKKIFRF